MISKAAVRASNATSKVARRGFHSTRAQLSSPYHYPEGPRSNLPFDPLRPSFKYKYWTGCFIGFFAPFGVAAWQTFKNKA